VRRFSAEDFYMLIRFHSFMSAGASSEGDVDWGMGYRWVFLMRDLSTLIICQLRHTS
jgi:hypothetical protein